MISLENLFPPQVSCVFSDCPPDTVELLPDETGATRAMQAGRLREFAHGRGCAREALSRIGYSECPVPVGNDREPLWPEGVVGSISHSGDRAAAVVVQQADCRGIGVDLEINEPLDPSLLSMLCRPEELDRIAESPEAGARTKLIFSAKESVFKCIWPAVHRFVDFDEIEIRFDDAGRSYSVKPHSDKLPGDLIRQIRGRYAQTPSLIVTGAYIQQVGAG